MNQQAVRLPAAFTGVWYDLNIIGTSGGTFLPNFTQGLFCVLGPVYWAKVGAIFDILFAGLGAWFFFRQLKLVPLACLAGGLAAALNSDFFSTACWGVGAQTLCFGLTYFGLGMLHADVPRWPWLRFTLAGLLVGLGVTEAFDIGAIFSLLFAAHVFYSALAGEGALAQRIGRGVGRVALVAAFAAFIAAQGLNVLIATNIKGVAGAQQDAQTKAFQWNFATQWSLPKLETLSLFVPGLFGYRLDTPDGGNYWGAIGRDAAWDEYFKSARQGPPPDGRQRFIRHTGGGIYQGVVVALVGFWAAAQAVRRKDSVFNLPERKLLWFWMGVVGISLLLAFGRHAPFYQLLYALPYFSTIRNPAKFVHVLSFALVVLFAYGVHGLSRRYMECVAVGAADLSARLKNWWSRTGPFDKRWVRACAIVLGASLLSWLIYSSSRQSLEQYLQTTGFDEQIAKAIAAFSIRQVGWFVLFFLLAAGLLIGIFSGAFAGPRAKWGGALLTLLLVIDLGRANLPWPIFWNYEDKYATNQVLDLLREKPYEHRVTIMPPWVPQAFRVEKQLEEAEKYLDQLYYIEWVQQQFQYYNIQSLDVIQMPRAPQDLEAFERTLQFRGTQDSLHLISRNWELTNTRYILAAFPFTNILNQVFDPAGRRFQTLALFNITSKPGVVNPTGLQDLTAVLSTNGPWALIEFTGALPRAKLFPNWQLCAKDPAAISELSTNLLSTNDLAFLKTIGTNDFLTLRKLASPSFDPQQTVLLAEPPLAAASSPAGAASQNPGTVDFVSYAPKRIVLRARANAPSILLLNDRFDPDWKVSVDGKPETLLRCNYIMRGVQLAAGDHAVEFRFAPRITGFYVSLAAIAVGLAIIGLLIFPKSGQPIAVPQTTSRSPATVAAKK